MSEQGNPSSEPKAGAAQKPRGREKKRNFYMMRPSWRGVLGVDLENEREIKPPNTVVLALPDPAKRGLSVIKGTPRFRYDKRNGRMPFDFDEFRDWWIVSSRAKALLEAIDPEACVFVSCDFVLKDGLQAPPIWFCDVTRVLDVIDEDNTIFDISEGISGKHYILKSPDDTFVIPSRIGESKIFRIKGSENNIVCDDEIRQFYKEEKFSGISFRKLKYR